MLPSYFETARKYHTVLADTTRWGQWGTDQRTQEKELLFPEIFDEKVLARAEKRMGDLEFAGQHQQRPTPAAGNLFKAEYFCPDPEGKTFWPASLLYDQKIIEAYICWDTAAKKGAHTDYWAGILVAMPADGRVLLVPLVLEKYDVPEGEKRVLLEWAKWKPILGAALHGAPIEEGASNATAVVQNARRLMAHRREQELEFEVWRQNGYDENAFDWKTPVGWESDEWNSVCESPPFHPLPYPPKPTKKVPRARGVLSFCQGRNARLVSIDDYVTRQWLSQLLAFPLGHDDAVDATVTGLERVAGLNDNAPAAGDDIVSRMKFKKRIVTP
jgi:phage terminase large subunit-like protein